MSQVFGHVYAPAYDILYRDKDYDGEVRLLDKIFRRYAPGEVRTVLDLGCGTGNHALRLMASGYGVVGVDRSAEMLAIARKKAQERAQTLRLHQADLRDLNLGELFDAALMMFAVLGYQIEDGDVRKAFDAARRHLRPGGLLAFDFWHGPAVVKLGTEERVRTIEAGDHRWVRASSGKLDHARHLCDVTFHLKHLEGSRTIEEITECHRMRYFFPEELGARLSASGFQLLRLGAFPEIDREPDESTWNVMGIAAAI
jgi:SAM-dependent methyltransferase